MSDIQRDTAPDKSDIKAGRKNKWSAKKKFIVYAILFVVLVGALCGGYVIKTNIDYQKWIALMEETVNVDTFYEGIFLDGIALGGLTLEEAEKQFESKAKEELNKLNFTFVYDDKTWDIKYDDIAAHIDWEDKTKQLYSIAREGDLEERYNRVMLLSEEKIEEATKLTYDEGLLRNKLGDIVGEINEEAVDAEIEFHPNNNQKFTITEEKSGLFLDLDELISNVKARIEEENYGLIALSPETVEPEVKAADLQKLTSRIVQFSTDLQDSSADRAHNVKLALSKVNGLRLDPGEVFSFNEIVGRRTTGTGFRMAPVIMADKSLQDSIGGGICQSSTTLYNAALRADLEIVERSHHSFPVSYIPKGLDAAVSYGSLDLKFKNNRNTPVFIRTFSSGNRVYAEIYGEEFPKNGKIECTSTVTETVAAPAPDRILDEKGEYVSKDGGEVEYVKSRNGYRVTSYKHYYENGSVVRTEVIVRDYYRPIKGITYYRPKVEKPEPEPKGEKKKKNVDIEDEEDDEDEEEDEDKEDEVE